MLHKGHAPFLGIPLLLALAIIFGLSGLIEAAAAPFAPIGGASTASYDAAGRVSHHMYIGHELPPLPKRVATAQGPGPIPDTNMTPTAQVSEERDPTVAPDRLANRVVFSSNGVDEDGNARIDPTFPADPDFVANYNLWLMRPDGSEQVQLTRQPDDEIQPAYSPGGNLIAYAGNQTGRWEIYLIEVRAPNVIQCLTDRQAGNKMHPTWSPDGNFLAYQCDVNGDWDIYKLPASGAALQTQLTNSPGDDTDPTWVPNSTSGGGLGGNAILYTSFVGVSTRIARVDANSFDVEILSDGRGNALANDREPAWSEDGNFIAFASDRLMDGDTTPDYNIFRMSGVGELTGPEAFPVSNLNVADTTDDRNPAWSTNPPDTSETLAIFYESDRADQFGAEVDIWRTLFQDVDPPMLGGLPFTTVGNENARKTRVFTPGNEVFVHVRAFDEDSGVSAVFVTLKDPDQKIFVSGGGALWDSGFNGDSLLEWDYQAVTAFPLFDDGDPANGDAVAGDGIFGGAWTVPPGLLSDFVIDVLVADNSGNSQVYDSVYGFTSEVFSPSSNVLFVNDYCEGQKFIYELGYSRSSNDWFAQYYVESFYLFHPNAPAEAVGNIEYNSISGYAQMRGVFTDGPDVWRVICRGPVPNSVYQYYLPTVEYQLDPLEAMDNPETATPTRQVQVANRTVIWAAPHTGDVWVADGSIIDAGTQADLGLFMDRGGRLMLSGMDIAWALTLNGTVTNNFLTNYLHCNFVRDTLGNTNPNYGWGLNGVGAAPFPVLQQSFATHGGYINAAEFPQDMDSPVVPPTTSPNHRDAHLYSHYPDVIQEDTSPGVVKLWDYSSGGTAGLRYENPVTTAKLVFLSFGFESIHRGYHTVNNVPRCKNHRSHLMHNVLCWTRTGGFKGRVIAIDDGKPITNPNPVILMWNTAGKPLGDRNTPPDYAVRCQDDGRYRIQGIPAGWYTMEAFRPEFEIDHFNNLTTHGGWGSFEQNFAMSRSRPGVVAGIVTSEATSSPLPLVEVEVYPILPEDDTTTAGVSTAQTVNGQEPVWDDLFGPVGNATTAVDGSYKIENLAPGDYYIRAKGEAIGYGDDWAQITITSGNTTKQDFQLPAADGTLVVTVADVADASPIANALVSVKTALGVQVGSGTTDSTGAAQLDVQPGQYQVTAQAAGYQMSTPKSATVQSSDTATVAFSLAAEPPGSLTGSVTSSTSGAPVGGVLVRLMANTTILATTTTADTLTSTGNGGATYNYRFDNVPTGPITVQPAPVGFTASPTERTVTVESGVSTNSVNFSLNSLHVFPAGLQLMSTPYDYAGVDPAGVLNLDPSLLKMATWEASRQRYRSYPQAPADRFRLGTGYWTRLNSVTDVTLQGGNAPDPMPVVLSEGWNLIGCPFPVLVDFYSTIVRDQSGIAHSVQQALSDGLLEGGMFAYVLGGYQNTAVYNPWVGTWLKTGRELTLEISATAGALAAPADARPAVPAPKDGWLASLVTSVDGLVDSSTHFGMAESATVGFDRGTDMSKPPAADFAPFVYSALANDAWAGGVASCSVDVRPEGDATWRLSVLTSQKDSDVTIQWPDLSAAPASVRPVLKDLVTGKTVYMRTNSGYTFKAGADARNFEISVSNSANAPLAVTGVSGQQAGGGQFQIVYSLSADASVDVEILNIAGRPVSRVCSGQVQTSGSNTVLWNGMSGLGTKAPGGRYLVKVTARTEEGQEKQAVVPMMVGR